MRRYSKTMTDEPRSVSRSKFEFEEGGQVAYLEFEVDGSEWITLWHTEVPPALRGRGIAGMLAKTALEYARDQGLKVDVICPIVADYIVKNPEFKTLVGR
jgi:predicted GNAT family acetyltransferase